jgi:hypothetical protein
VAKNLPDRSTEGISFEEFGARKDSFREWHERIDAIDAIIGGDKGLVVNNLADQMPRDVARLSNEVKPTYRAPELKEGIDGERDARVRAHIGRGYFDLNRFDLIRPVLAMDLLRSGTAFLVHWTDSSSQYPRLMRVDPRNTYPDVLEGEIQDLLVSTTVKARIADRKWPGLHILARLRENEESEDTVEIVDYYGLDGDCWKAIVIPNQGQPTIVARYEAKGLTIAPVAFGNLPAPDGVFRGLIDQIGPGLMAKDKMVKDLMEYAHEMVYAPFEAKGIVNSDTPPGPDTIYQHDPTATTETFMRRVQPASSNPQVLGLVQFLDGEQRNQVAYPATRQGEVPVSQGSGQFINATQGQLTSLVRDVQRVLTVMQQDSAKVMFGLDKLKLDFEKPLLKHVKRKKTYVPSRDIKDDRLEVTLGFGSGLDAMSATVQHLQVYGTGVYPAKRMLANFEFVDDAEGYIEERQLEELDRVALQRFAGDPSTNLEFVIAVAAKMDEEGVSFRAAMQAVAAEGIAPQVAPPAGQPGMPQPPGAVPGEPGADQAALQQGAIPGPGGAAPPIPGEFSKTPMQQVFVSGQR